MISSSASHSLVLVLFLLVCISSMLNAANGASISYTLYSDTSCANSVVSSTASAFSTQGITQTGCDAATGTGILNANYYIANCGYNQVPINSVIYYSDSACKSPVGTIQTNGNAWGTCTSFATDAAVGHSMTITACNSAISSYSTTLPLMLILAIILFLAM